jgi:hypothetical protein
MDRIGHPGLGAEGTSAATVRTPRNPSLLHGATVEGQRRSSTIQEPIVDRLAVLVPSRGRPHNIARLIEAMNATCRGDTTLIVGVDDDDPYLDQYLAFSGCKTVVLADYQRQLVAWLNVLATWYARGYSFLGHIGDDNVPRTVGWDVQVMESLKHHNFCHADDLDPGRPAGSLSLTIFMRSEVIKTLGYMGPPQLQHMYVDPVWFAWGQATSIEFLSDVVIEHMHYTISGKAPHDESYALSTALIPRDCDAYNDYCEDPEGLNADIAKLGGTMFTPEGLAEFNRGLNIPRRWGQAA